MAKLRVALVLMILFVASAKWWKQAHAPAAVFAPVAVTVSASPIDGRLEPAPREPSSERAIDQKNQVIVRECLEKDASLPRVHLSRRITLEDVLSDLNAHTDSTMMNVHVRRADGSEERLHAEPHDPSAKNAFKIGGEDVRVFDVDKEGLPIVKPYPSALRQDSLKHIVDSFVGNDRVSFKERREHHTFTNGAATSVETNGRMTELQLNFGRNTLGCAWQNGALNCACL